MGNKEAIKYLIAPIATSTEPSAEYLKQKESYELAIKALEEREADRWIPVSERPPKVSGYYLVTRTGNSGKGYVRRSFYDVSLKEWDESRVTAWQPLPEAYKESEDE